MKKGSRVRVLRNGKVGTVADSMFFCLHGRREVRYQVRLKGERTEPAWYAAAELGSVTETVKVTLEAEDGQVLTARLGVDHDTGKTSIQVEGRPENLKEHSGLHVTALNAMFRGLGAYSRED